jgi:RNA polymerase sigma-70 factor (ECF subfamily)
MQLEAVDERGLVEALRRGDEAAFAALVRRHNPAMLRLATDFVGDRAVAEEVVQDTWQALVEGLDRFQGRSTLKTWLFHVVANRARTRWARERRSVPFAALARAEAESDEPAVDPDRFFGPDGPGAAGHWSSPPRSWDGAPEERLLARETRARLAEAIASLPPTQRVVLTLRDVEGWSSDEVRNVLDISETNVRVLLHRARAKVRRALEQYLDGESTTR